MELYAIESQAIRPETWASIVIAWLEGLMS